LRAEDFAFVFAFALVFALAFAMRTSLLLTLPGAWRGTATAGRSPVRIDTVINKTRRRTPLFLSFATD
jgi:hypothetical protein